MPLSIKNPATELLARQVAGETGESLTEAIQKALEQRWDRLRAKRRNHFAGSQVEEMLRRVDALATLDSRADEEILGYGKDRIPK
jgi:antitoxin VapB